MAGKIAFQGAPGAYGDLACRQTRPDLTPLHCGTFEEVIKAVKSGEAERAVLPVENTTYGRVADIHRLLPESDLHIVGETFVRVQISLLALPGSRLEDIKVARGHMVILPQCRSFLDANSIRAEVAADNAGAAADIAATQEKGAAALASNLAAEVYGLDVIAENIENEAHNTTRFLLMSPTPEDTRLDTPMKTTFVFQVRNIPAALYKAMGGFATNGVNMTKLESYMVGGTFTATQFYADIEGHPDDQNVALALEELRFFTSQLKILGSYAAAKIGSN